MCMTIVSNICATVQICNARVQGLLEWLHQPIDINLVTKSLPKLSDLNCEAHAYPLHPTFKTPWLISNCDLWCCGTNLQNFVMRIHIYWIRTVHWSSFSSSSYNTLAATLYTTHCSVHVLLKIEEGGIDKAGGKQEDQWNIVCLCAPENGSFCVQGTFAGVSIHEWTVILQVLKQAHLPPSSWHHLHNCIPDQNVDTSSLSRQLAEKSTWQKLCSGRLTVSSGWYQDRRALGRVLLSSATRVFWTVSFWAALQDPQTGQRSNKLGPAE